MRATRWPSYALDPAVLAEKHPNQIHSALVCVGHPDYLDELLDAAQESGDQTALLVAELILEVEIHTTQHDPRPEVVGQANRIIHQIDTPDADEDVANGGGSDAATAE